jgi:hypothetical protein
MKAVMAIEDDTKPSGTNGGPDLRREKNPREEFPTFTPPRSPVEVAANCANAARAAALESVGMSGEALGAALSSERTSKENATALVVLSGKVDALNVKIDAIALAVNARRSFASGSMAAVLPSSTPLPPVSIKTSPSPTGEHQRISQSELERLEARDAEMMRLFQAEKARADRSDAEEEGARKYAAELEVKEEKRVAMWKDRREKAVAGIAIAGAAFGLWHFVLSLVH